MFARFGVILAVDDLERSIAFYSALGFPVAQRCFDGRAVLVAFNDNVQAILQTTDRFATLTAREIVDPNMTVEVIVSLSLGGRAQVDELVDRALVAGGRPAGESIDRTSFYRRGFLDPDGHQFAVECGCAASHEVSATNVRAVDGAAVAMRSVTEDGHNISHINVEED